MPNRPYHHILALALFGAILVSGCSLFSTPLSSEIPLVPLDFVDGAGGVAPWRAPIHVRDRHLQLAVYSPSGDIRMELHDETVFPTDVLIVHSKDAQTVVVFLRRSPHGGCLLSWDLEEMFIHDPCFGSRFDLSGRITSGPSQRNLDQLPASIREGVVWVGNEVQYGAPRP